MEALKPCPRCGNTEAKEFIRSGVGERRVDVDCGECWVSLTKECWQAPRPLEDSLRAEIAAIREHLLRLHNVAQCPNCDTCIRALRREIGRQKKRNREYYGGVLRLAKENVTLKERITRLEAIRGAAAELMEDIDLYEGEDNPRILALRKALENVG